MLATSGKSKISVWTPAASFLMLALAAFLYRLNRPVTRGFAAPRGLDPVSFPADNPYSPAKAGLGRALFYDPRLSLDGTVSCATCHNPGFAFSVAPPFGVGVRGQTGSRKPPTIINAAYSPAFFWDSRASTLEEQALGPLMNPTEMGNTPAKLISTVSAIKGYRERFRDVFGDEQITVDRLAKAIASFERTVLSGNAPYDRWVAGDRSALSPSQVRGAALFRDAKCNACHEGPTFTNGMMANLGVGMEKSKPDVGSFAITHEERDWGRFKTPGLRDVAIRPPYMHDGSLCTLEEVVDFYDRGGNPNRNLDNRKRPLHLSAGQKADLVAFLHSLSGAGWQQAKAPATLPQ